MSLGDTIEFSVLPDRTKDEVFNVSGVPIDEANLVCESPRTVKAPLLTRELIMFQSLFRWQFSLRSAEPWTSTEERLGRKPPFRYATTDRSVLSFDRMD